jgi:hypothetical protein
MLLRWTDGPMSLFCVRLRPDFSCNLCAFLANKPDRLLSISVQFVHFRVKTWFFARHVVIVSFVFMHIAGSIFIFNIFMGQRPASDLGQRVGGPPQWGCSSQIDNRKSTISRRLESSLLCVSSILLSFRARDASGNKVFGRFLNHKPFVFDARISQKALSGWASRRQDWQKARVAYCPSFPSSWRLNPKSQILTPNS